MSTSHSLSDAIDALIAEQERAALPAWKGAPLHFSGAYHHPEQLDAATKRWALEHNQPGPSRASNHQWNRAVTGGRMDLGAHTLDTFTADLRCTWWRHEDDDPTWNREDRCSCVGGYLQTAICTRCSWHAISEDENEVVEAWHDHALPGWRDLPVLPHKLRGQMGTSKMTPKLAAWLEENYPPELRINGSPILTLRTPHGTRHVPGYSPYGGYDISVGIAPDR